ncbi:MAG TPA: endonuclease NucS domain-containing protein [Candidatus Dormibacteraeota bacterium]|nr:endonuclease NucS domain-containing protein [Candidatus Dormibacteraeota bacterium]
MKLVEYRQWLEAQRYQANTITAQIHRALRVEEHHGDLDEHYTRDRMGSLIQALTYSTNDRLHNRPNPSQIPFEGDIYNNLASYRDAVKRYRRFSDEFAENGLQTPAPEDGGTVTAAEEVGQRIGLERDMQAALRIEIEQLEPGLTIIDDGAERSVESGFIDITARDASGTTVVIELKAGVAGQRAVAQILSYMGDVAADEEGGRVRGILVASSFDPRARAAARMVPSLILRKYSVRFTFSDGHT